MELTRGPAGASPPAWGLCHQKSLGQLGPVDDQIRVTLVLQCNRSHTQG